MKRQKSSWKDIFERLNWLCNKKSVKKNKKTLSMFCGRSRKYIDGKLKEKYEK